ncbi:MAG: helix-turn-helix transcriptional regulator [Pseudomonadota bacterium]
MKDKTPSPVRQRFAEQLRRLRQEAGYSRARALAQALQIDENRYTRYERAEVEPSLTLIMQICRVLGVTPNALFGQDDTVSAEAGGAHAGAAPGMAEGSGGDDAPRDSSPVRLLRIHAWRVAVLLASLQAANGAKADAPAFDEIAATSNTYERIIADPFGAAVWVLADPAVQSAEEHRKGCIAKHVAAMTDAATKIR